MSETKKNTSEQSTPEFANKKRKRMVCIEEMQDDTVTECSEFIEKKRQEYVEWFFRHCNAGQIFQKKIIEEEIISQPMEEEKEVLSYPEWFKLHSN